MKKSIPIEKIILGTVAAVGVLAIVAIAPGIGPVVRMFDRKRKYRESDVSRAVKRLSEKGYISYLDTKGNRKLQLTKKGEERLRRYEQRDVLMGRKKPRLKKSKYWHVVVFDVKEERKTTRDNIRRQLVAGGFMRLQNSVWVSPYESEEFAALLRADNRIGGEVLYMRVEYIENEDFIRKKFGI